MGAKDLEWRTGGSGQGAADGGRDLEARFYMPAADGELEAQKWWVECKGRSGTLETGEVKSAVNNALAIDGLDCLVVATNTQFSNPTRDWMKQWQASHPRPKVKLWDQAQLERYLSRHPDVVLRLFSEALSLDGRFKALEVRFWNKLEFVAPKTLADLWEAREGVSVTAMGVFAAIANEFANGSIVARPWAAIARPQSLIEVFCIAFQNVAYLAIRCSSAGVDQKIIFQSLAYLVLAALDLLPAEHVAALIIKSLNRGEEESMPETAQDMLLAPVVGQLLSEIREVCSSDCKRVMSLDRSTLRKGNDEVDDYWLRLESDSLKESEDHRTVRIEKLNEPCLVGFSVGKDHLCPLFTSEPSVKNFVNILAVIKRVAAFRKAQAAVKRETEKQNAAQLRQKMNKRKS